MSSPRSTCDVGPRNSVGTCIVTGRTKNHIGAKLHAAQWGRYREKFENQSDGRANVAACSSSCHVWTRSTKPFQSCVKPPRAQKRSRGRSSTTNREAAILIRPPPKSVWTYLNFPCSDPPEILYVTSQPRPERPHVVRYDISNSATYWEMETWVKTLRSAPNFACVAASRLRPPPCARLRPER